MSNGTRRGAPEFKGTHRRFDVQWEKRFSDIGKKKENWVIIPVVVVLVLILLFTIGTALNLGNKEPQLSAYSNHWNDLSHLRSKCNQWGFNTSSIVSSPLILETLDDPGSAVLLIIGVEEEYMDSERGAIADFLEDGGSVVIADDFGYGDSIANLEGGTHEVTFTGKKVYDESYVKNPKFVKAQVQLRDLIGVIGSGSDSYNYYDGDVGRSYELLFNEPSALKINGGSSRNVNIIAQSSQYSWRDDDGNGERDLDEPVESHPLIVNRMGHRIWYISDPGIFVNDFINRSDNSLFIEYLIRYLVPVDGTVIFEESRHISNSVTDNSHSTFYEMVIVATSDFWLYISIVIILLVTFGITRYKTPKQKRWEDVNALHNRSINTLSYPWLSPNDHQWVRSIFIERVRLSAGLSNEEFLKMTPWHLQGLINDPELYDLCFNPYTASYIDLNRVVEKIETWEPSSVDQEQGKRVEVTEWVEDDDLPMLKEEDVIFHQAPQEDVPPNIPQSMSPKVAAPQRDLQREKEGLSSLGGPFQDGWEWESSTSHHPPRGSGTGDRREGIEEF